MSALSEALNEANVDAWSSREIARRTGDRVHHATVSKFMNGKHSANPGDDVLSAFSEVFGIPLTDLRDLAGRPAGEFEPYTPPPEASLLNPRQRKAIDELIRSMVIVEDALPAYLATVLDSLTVQETVQFLIGLEGSVRDRLEVIRRQRRRWVDEGGVSIWDSGLPDTAPYREAREEYEEYVFAQLPDEVKGRPVDGDIEAQRGPEPEVGGVIALQQRRRREAQRQEAARAGEPNLARGRQQQDAAGEVPDPEGPEGGA